MTPGTITSVNGPVVEVEALDNVAMLDLVEVGPKRLPGEIIALANNSATIQVYEYTGGLEPGQTVWPTGAPLKAELGPGLIGTVLDGMLRRMDTAPEFLGPAARESTLARDRRWEFTPSLTPGDEVTPGSLLGRIPESAAIEHRLLAPADVSGRLEWIAPAGAYAVDERIAVVGERELFPAQLWPVRRPRPARSVTDATGALRTGQRVVDLLYPIARGSTAAIPGGFGTGKTLLLQQIAKWCDADVIVYVACGERGNELADVLSEFAQLEDPRTGQSLLDRTVLIANTSNMPVMAREASIQTGATVAEYYRDMGYEVVMIADSTSRWAEALREVSARTDQLPAEEGYPAGLAFALASFYERAGQIETAWGQRASLTILAAVSPPGGDMTEPVTAHTQRFVRCLWSLDRDLAYARHYPAISWRDSSSRDVEILATRQAARGDPGFGARRARAMHLLAEADRLEAVAQLVGAGSLPDPEQVLLLAARLLRTAVLQQSALSPNDAYCTAEKGAALLSLVLDIHDAMLALLDRGIPAATILEMDFSSVVRIRDETPPDGAAEVDSARASWLSRLQELT